MEDQLTHQTRRIVLEWVCPPLEVPIGLSGFQILPDHEPDTTNSQNCDCSSRENDRLTTPHTEALCTRSRRTYTLNECVY